MTKVPPSKIDTTTEMIWTYVRRTDWVSFIELMRAMEANFPTRGTHAIELPGTNVVLWEGMSEQLSNAVLALVRDKMLFFHPTQLLTYLIDGAILRLPIARRPPPRGYVQPHWCPVCLRTRPILGKRSIPTVVSVNGSA